MAVRHYLQRKKGLPVSACLASSGTPAHLAALRVSWTLWHKGGDCVSKPRRPISPAQAARLKALRQERGITQERLAEMVGRTEQCIRLYENARLGISPQMLEALRKALGADSSHL